MLRRASTKFAHNSTIPVLGTNQELKPLQNLINAEKAVLVSLKKLSVDYIKASDALKTWGLGEGTDLGDILSASSSLLNIFSSALIEYSSHGDFMRKQLKLIRTKEESLENLKRRRSNAHRKAKDLDKKLTKMGPVHKNLSTQKESLVHLQEETQKMDAGILLEEAALNEFKRTATKAWMGLKFGGLVECCQKGTIAGEFGKLIIAEILEKDTRSGSMPQSLDSHSQVDGLYEEAYQNVNAVALSINPPVGFRDSLRDQQQNREPSNTPPACPHRGGSPQSNHEPSSERRSPLTSILRSRRGTNPRTVEPFPFSSSNHDCHSRKNSGKSSSGYAPNVPPNQQQLSQGTSSSSQSSPSSQQPGVNENAVNDSSVNVCAVHRSASPQQPGVNESAVNDSSANVCAVHRSASPSLVNSCLPSSSKSLRYQDPSPSIIGRQVIGDSSSSSSTTATSHSTITNRSNGWLRSSEGYNQPRNSCGDALLYSDPPPSFDDALLDDSLSLIPVGGSSSQVSLANTTGHSSARPFQFRT